MYDVGMAIIGTCCSQTAVIPDRIQYLLQGYVQEVKMTTDEQQALQAFTVYAGASMTFWRHRNFNYLKPNPALKDHYRGLQILSDSARSLKPECFKIPLH